MALFGGCNAQTVLSVSKPSTSKTMTLPQTARPVLTDSSDVLILGGGCFWCVEAVFDAVRGVTDVESGYAGGHVEKPTYRAVCEKTTGHAEVIKVVYNPQVVSLDNLLRIFFTVHDPTTLNRQGNDVGPQYRSAIYYFDDRQREASQRIIAELQPQFLSPIVTEVTAFSNYYSAEGYHQEYFALHGSEPYCSFVIAPKMKKFYSQWADFLK